MDLLAVQGTLKRLLQHHSSKALILQCSAFLMVQLSHPNMTTGKTIALTRWTFDSKVMSLLFNVLSRFVIAFLSRSKHLLISWLQSPSAVIWSPENKVCHGRKSVGLELYLRSSMCLSSVSLERKSKGELTPSLKSLGCTTSRSFFSYMVWDRSFI